jgi:hypothetical protein
MPRNKKIRILIKVDMEKMWAVRTTAPYPQDPGYSHRGRWDSWWTPSFLNPLLILVLEGGPRSPLPYLPGVYGAANSRPRYDPSLTGHSCTLKLIDSATSTTSTSLAYSTTSSTTSSASTIFNSTSAVTSTRSTDTYLRRREHDRRLVSLSPLMGRHQVRVLYMNIEAERHIQRVWMLLI